MMVCLGNSTWLISESQWVSHSTCELFPATFGNLCGQEKIDEKLTDFLGKAWNGKAG